MSFTDNLIASCMGLCAMFLTTLLIGKYPGDTSVAFVSVSLAAFIGIMFGSWMAESYHQESAQIEEEPAPVPEGTYSCPICDSATPHPHSPEQIEAWRESEMCQVPPEGWACIREPGHEGPCAAVPR